MSTIRVLSVLLDDSPGGPGIRTLTVAEGLRKFRIETILLIPTGHGSFDIIAKKCNFRVYRIPLRTPRELSVATISENIKWLISIPASICLISKIIDHEKIDIIHVNGLLSIQASLSAIFKRKKLVWHLINPQFYPKILIRLLFPFVKVFADKIIFVSSKAKEGYTKNSKTNAKMSIIHEGIDYNKYDPKSIDESSIVKFKRNFGKKVIGCIGNINPAKGYEYFIKAFHILKKNVPDVSLIIVGQIIDTRRLYYEELKKLIALLKLEQDIFFLGWRNDIKQLLAIMDVFVLCSVTEGLPLAILEAMSMEKPIVATNVGAIPEQILHRETGIIVPKCDVKAVADAAIFLINNPQIAIKMGKKARERVKKNFSLEKCILKHKKIYMTLCQNGSERRSIA